MHDEDAAPLTVLRPPFLSLPASSDAASIEREGCGEEEGEDCEEEEDGSSGEGSKDEGWSDDD